MIFKNCTFFNEMFEKEVGDIKVENGKIAEIGFFNEGGVDMSGCLVLPGFVDIHIHGGEGADFSDGDTASFDAMSRYLAKHGVTSFCGTTMTLSQDKLRRIVSAAADYTAPKSKLVGINLEGPYIAMSKKGAQNAEYVRAGSVDEVRELYSICDKIKLITIAPEAFDSAEFIKEVSRFMSVSVGHSAANAEQCRTAFENGANHITHLFNAMITTMLCAKLFATASIFARLFCVTRLIFSVRTEPALSATRCAAQEWARANLNSAVKRHMSSRATRLQNLPTELLLHQSQMFLMSLKICFHSALILKRRSNPAQSIRQGQSASRIISARLQSASVPIL